METIGIFGLGIIGTAWARRYAAAGVLAGTWNRSPQPEAPLWHESALTLAQKASFIHLVVADPPALASVLQIILPALGSGKLVLQSSTIDPASSAAFQEQVQATGADYVEGPFTGSKPAAEEGKSVFFLGGAEAPIARARSVLSHLSEVQFVIGTGAQAAAVKLAMNLNLAAQMEVLSESLTFVRRAGIPDETYFAVLAKNASYSYLAKLKEPKLREGDFSPQFSVKHMAKDMRLAEASAAGASYPLLSLLRARLRQAEDAGLGDEDFCALVKLLAGDSSPGTQSRT